MRPTRRRIHAMLDKPLASARRCSPAMKLVITTANLGGIDQWRCLMCVKSFLRA